VLSGARLCPWATNRDLQVLLYAVKGGLGLIFELGLGICCSVLVLLLQLLHMVQEQQPTFGHQKSA